MSRPFSHNHARGDQVLYRAPFRSRGRRPWLAAEVLEVSPHELLLLLREGPRAGETLRLQLGGAGQVRPLTLREQQERQQQAAARRPARTEGATVEGPALALLRAAAPQPAPLPILRPVLPRAVPRPEPPLRSASYLAMVRAWPCCGCGRPAPSEAHHAGRRGVGQKASDLLTVPLCRPCHQRVTDTGSLPGLDRDGTLLRVVTAQRDLLARWVARALQERAAEAAAAIPVPLLARRAS